LDPDGRGLDAPVEPLETARDGLPIYLPADKQNTDRGFLNGSVIALHGENRNAWRTVKNDVPTHKDPGSGQINGRAIYLFLAVARRATYLPCSG